MPCPTPPRNSPAAAIRHTLLAALNAAIQSNAATHTLSPVISANTANNVSTLIAHYPNGETILCLHIAPTE